MGDGVDGMNHGRWNESWSMQSMRVDGLPQGSPSGCIQKSKSERHLCPQRHHEFKELMLTRLASLKPLPRMPLVILGYVLPQPTLDDTDIRYIHVSALLLPNCHPPSRTVDPSRASHPPSRTQEYYPPLTLTLEHHLPLTLHRAMTNVD
jgi:hypothetical protein